MKNTFLLATHSQVEKIRSWFLLAFHELSVLFKRSNLRDRKKINSRHGETSSLKVL